MIYVIITTSINNKNDQNARDKSDVNHRKERYMNSIKSLLKMIENEMEIKAIVVENNGSRRTYLDELGCDVVYTKNNEKRYAHKGVNELLDMQEVIRRYEMKDEDMIIKLTGRYKVIDETFVNLVKTKMERYDAFVKFYNVCALEYMQNDSVMGLFGLRCKYLKSLEYKCNTSPECELAQHVRRNVPNDRIMEVKHLGLECCFADDLRLLNV
jgi:hypothetical protein